MRRLVRRALLSGLLVGSVTLIPATAASAHVHGVTPLLQCSDVVSSHAGATQTEVTPAFSTNGGPIPTGLIPKPLDFGDGGFDAPVQCP